MFSPASTLILSLVLSFAPRLSQATCYWQNSTLAPDDPYSIAPDDTACFPDQDNSPCCGTGWTCLSDGVCYIEIDNTEFYYRGTCTDRTWDSQQCPGWCFAQNANSSIPMAKCDTTQDWYCCPGDSDCSCDTGKNAVKLGDTQPSTVTVIGSTSWPGITSTTTPFTQSSPLVTDGTTTSTEGGSDTTTGSTSIIPTTSPTHTSSGTGTAAAASETSTAPAASSGDSSSNTGLAAGLGAGLGAAAVLIGVLIFFLIRNRRRRTASKPTVTDSANNSPDLSDPMVPKATYASSQAMSHYSDDPRHMATEAPATPYRPELAAAGEYDRSEMPTQSNTGTVSRPTTQRVELPS